MSKPPFYTVTAVGPFDLPLRHDETDEVVIAFLVGSSVDDQDRISGSCSLSESEAEIFRIDHPVCAR